MKILRHIVSAGLGVDAIRNLYNGALTSNESYYQIAAIEGLTVLGIEIAGYINDKRKKTIDKFTQEVAPLLILMAKQVNTRCSKCFRDLQAKLDDIKGDKPQT